MHANKERLYQPSIPHKYNFVCTWSSQPLYHWIFKNPSAFLWTISRTRFNLLFHITQNMDKFLHGLKLCCWGVFKKALRQAGYTAQTANSSLDDESCSHLKGDLLFRSSSAGVFLHRLLYHVGVQLSADDCVRQYTWHCTGQPSTNNGNQTVFSCGLWAFPPVLHSKYPPLHLSSPQVNPEVKNSTKYCCGVQKIWGLPRERSLFFTHIQKSSQSI